MVVSRGLWRPNSGNSKAYSTTYSLDENPLKKNLHTKIHDDMLKHCHLTQVLCTKTPDFEALRPIQRANLCKIPFGRKSSIVFNQFYLGPCFISTESVVIHQQFNIILHCERSPTLCNIWQKHFTSAARVTLWFLSPLQRVLKHFQDRLQQQTT